jgi:hypothetical protein
MKKALLVLAILCIALVSSCGTTGGGSSAAAGAGDSAPGDLGAFNLRLEDNFEYGEGYQALLYKAELFEGHQIVAGETYTLKITFTVSRDFEDDLLIGLVDPTPAANYWRALTWDDDKGIELEKIEIPKKDQEISRTITLKTLVDSTGPSVAANSLVFITKGEGKKGSGGSGRLKSATLSFTEFVFTKN